MTQSVTLSESSLAILVDIAPLTSSESENELELAASPSTQSVSSTSASSFAASPQSSIFSPEVTHSIENQSNAHEVEETSSTGISRTQEEAESPIPPSGIRSDQEHIASHNSTPRSSRHSTSPRTRSPQLPLRSSGPPSPNLPSREEWSTGSARLSTTSELPLVADPGATVDVTDQEDESAGRVTRFLQASERTMQQALEGKDASKDTVLEQFSNEDGAAILTPPDVIAPDDENESQVIGDDPRVVDNLLNFDKSQGIPQGEGGSANLSQLLVQSESDLHPIFSSSSSAPLVVVPSESRFAGELLEESDQRTINGCGDRLSVEVEEVSPIPTVPGNAQLPHKSSTPPMSPVSVDRQHHARAKSPRELPAHTPLQAVDEDDAELHFPLDAPTTYRHGPVPNLTPTIHSSFSLMMLDKVQETDNAKHLVVYTDPREPSSSEGAGGHDEPQRYTALGFPSSPVLVQRTSLPTARPQPRPLQSGPGPVLNGSSLAPGRLGGHTANIINSFRTSASLEEALFAQGRVAGDEAVCANSGLASGTSEGSPSGRTSVEDIVDNDLVTRVPRLPQLEVGGAIPGRTARSPIPRVPRRIV
ncbi:hypothetical protein H0H81_009768 [Sphagnurus paluster]|uniref:Uncharacterized protein n=1 Tax=Sphagnurus paluster TaxID=117069 RepID=A0A9P7FVL7_9AGAR|nr:hypothetical protein H0H81_009768 [Sphagnurus paluster]